MNSEASWLNPDERGYATLLRESLPDVVRVSFKGRDPFSGVVVVHSDMKVVCAAYKPEKRNRESELPVILDRLWLATYQFFRAINLTHLTGTSVTSKVLTRDCKAVPLVRAR